ncbi:hypothetical protein GCM10010168_90170 [Actinoplanes ianthinogenes]|uniref:DUF58 domain-containing protein n=1 Tax=Actinoplanes ianthinogenes TaxID=122358 RepID=A0ABM7M1T4_9ACTN|nr:DUF58 domain-containing protein [Actinoplanes ianthinogenes]BCJ45599.1 hypothetical protein Aiant_62560 [Actinoplanes ianthinogenes]GGR57200.1 hypothetical protein GCM10010168_90170 [Actinoplanes ianthinogenes]
MSQPIGSAPAPQPPAAWPGPAAGGTAPAGQPQPAWGGTAPVPQPQAAWPGPAAASADQAARTGPAGGTVPAPLEEAARAEAVLAKLQLLVTRKLDGLLQGDYVGLLPGPGTEAGESREYRPGDDVRRMDWPVTARTTLPHVRRTVADRELETWLAVDLSASLDFGTAKWLKKDLVIAAATAVTHLTARGGNRIGAVVGTGSGVPRSGFARGLFKKKAAVTEDAPGPSVVRMPARPGRKEAQGLLRAIARTRIRPGRTDLGALIDMLNRPPRRRGVAVVISDFLAPVESWARPVRKLGVRHDVLAIEVVDPRELELPDVGVLTLADPESGELHEVQTTDPGLRQRYAAAAGEQRAAIARTLRAAGASHLRLRTDTDWLLDIVRFVAAQRHARTRGTTR